MRTSWLRHTSCIAIVASVASGLPGRTASAQKHSLEFGAARTSWLAPSSIATSLSAQTLIGRPGPGAVAFGVRGNFSMRERSQPSGNIEVRINIATAVVGFDFPVHRSDRATIYGSASLAGSWFWHHYSGPGSWYPSS